MKRSTPWLLAVPLLGMLATIPWAQAWMTAHSTPRLQVPEGWPAPRYDFAGNPVTSAGFALGRRLFYDPILSRDGSVACGSCHQQFAAFAHLDHRVSHGIGGVNGKRNTPGLFNLAWQPELMWDGSVHHLELQPVAPMSNPVEMGGSLALAVDKLRRDARYPELFAEAFGSPGVDSQRLLRALAQFTGTLVSADSRYDRFVEGKEAFTPQERDGLDLFRERCASCHREPLFTDFSYRNNGLDAAPRDAGRAVISGRDEDRGRFRVPSLRNIALTAPYMHDGRYDSLEQVLDHYSGGVQPSPTLDPSLAGGVPLSPDQRSALLIFLDTLTDESFIHDRRFAETHD
ncbi:cytochrome-c peroxidase [Nevskia soli]|uniref:cytochrome-c peroxidase n=1 Tax=Nevskia soli TaxID=418856 RepID=UPI00147067A6|nr:cytochrome c peroxidase [Nevskia soli]